MTNSEVYDDLWHRPKKINHTLCKGDFAPTSLTYTAENRIDQYEVPRRPFNRSLFRVRRAIETLEDPNPLVMGHRYSVDIVLTGLREAFHLFWDREKRLALIAIQPAVNPKAEVA